MLSNNLIAKFSKFKWIGSVDQLAITNEEPLCLHAIVPYQVCGLVGEDIIVWFA
jgi:hypothetical protein